MKKIISLAIALCLMLTVCSTGLMSLTAAAAQTIEGSEVTWSFDNITKTLTFGGSGDIPDYDTYKDEDGSPTMPWAGIDYTNVVFGDGITGIGSYVFYKNYTLESLTVPATITKIGKGAFFECKGLRSITAEGGITKVDEQTFSTCSSLETVNLPETVTEIGAKAFYKCSALKTIALPDSVKTIGDSAFHSCILLEAFEAPDSLEKIADRAFYCCESLKTLTLGEKITEIGISAFDGCIKLEAVSFPSSVRTISEAAFSGCSKLASVEFSDGITTIGDQAFHLCTSLKSVNIPHTVETIGKKAFGYGKSGAKIDGFEVIGYAESSAYAYAEENGFVFITLDIKFDLAEGAVCDFDDENKIITVYNRDATIETITTDFIIGEDLTIEPLEKVATGERLILKLGERRVGSYSIVVLGDVNGDGQINSTDALLILQHSVESISLENEYLLASDLDRTNSVNSTDALIVLKLSVEIIENAHPHDFSEWKVVKEATCAEEGLEERECRCGVKETRSIPLTDHVFSEWKVVKDATCTEEGLEERTCPCGEKKETRVIPMIDHTFSEWVVEKEATCTEEGLESRVCSCGKKEERVISKKPHKYEKEYDSTEDCFKYTCTDCGYIYTESVPPITAYVNKTGTGITVTPGSVQYEVSFQVVASGGYGKLQYKYEVLASTSSDYVLFSQDFSDDPKIGLSSASSFDSRVLRVTIKDAYGHTSVFRFRMDSGDKI